MNMLEKITEEIKKYEESNPKKYPSEVIAGLKSVEAGENHIVIFSGLELIIVLTHWEAIRLNNILTKWFKGIEV